MSNFQHPGDSSSVPEDVKALINQNYNNGYSANVGYITADPIAPSITTK